MGHLISLGHTRIGAARRAAPTTSRRTASSPPPGRTLPRAGILFPESHVARAWYSIEAAQAGRDAPARRGRDRHRVRQRPHGPRRDPRRPARAASSVPGDVSVVGFDDSFLMNCTEPPLTTVRQPIEPMCRMVIELLVGQIAGSPITHDEVLFEPELVVRASTGPAVAATAGA